MKMLWMAMVLTVLSQALPVCAAEIAGVQLPDSATMDQTGEALVLNGAGVRKKFFVKVYVGALYLPDRATTPEEVYDMPGGKRVVMHFLYDEVSSQKLVKGWNDGFAANHTDAQLSGLQARLDNFNRLFTAVREGDVIQLDLLPGQGTSVRIRGQSMGTVEGDDFATALLKVWLGDSPADGGLKQAMLGK